jgi:hypothetical protein
LALEEALQEHEEQVTALLKSANRYVGALKAWKKACQTGEIGNLQKAAGQAAEIGRSLPEATEQTQSAWQFDVRGYLEDGDWIREVQSIATEKYDLRTIEDDGTLISSPVTVRSLPGRGTLAIGKLNWQKLRPVLVAEELKRLRDRAASANSQEFAESLFGAWQYLSSNGTTTVRFRDIYTLFSLTPGYKKDNPPAAFAQQIYALHRSGVRTTRGGRKFEIEYPSGRIKESDVFQVTAEDGRLLRYYSIYFI